MTPEEVEKIKHDLAHGCTYSYRWPQHRECLQMLFDAIESRAALAGQVVALREALEGQYEAIDEGFITGSSVDAWECNECGEFGEAIRHLSHTDECNQGKILKALALPLPEAAAMVAEWKEKAEELDRIHAAVEAAKGMFANPTLLKVPGYNSARCHCQPGKCGAPVIMGRQQPCLDPEKAAKEPVK